MPSGDTRGLGDKFWKGMLNNIPWEWAMLKEKKKSYCYSEPYEIADTQLLWYTEGPLHMAQPAILTGILYYRFIVPYS